MASGHVLSSSALSAKQGEGYTRHAKRQRHGIKDKAQMDRYTLYGRKPWICIGMLNKELKQKCVLIGTKYLSYLINLVLALVLAGGIYFWVRSLVFMAR